MWNPVLNSKQTDDVKISYKYDSKFLLHPIYKVAVKDVNGIEMNSKLIKEWNNENYLNSLNDNFFSLIAVGNVDNENYSVYNILNKKSQNLRNYH